MLETFLATLTPMLTLFTCIAVGFILGKTKILPSNAGKVMAKLETYVFCPALSFSTMSQFCTVSSLGNHATNILLSCGAVALALGIAIPLSRVFVRAKSPERGVFAYALAFANSGYIGDPVVQALFGDQMLSYYKLYCLPITILIYTWGISVLVPSGEKRDNPLKKILNAPTIAMLLGMAVGLSGLGHYIHDPILMDECGLEFIKKALDALKSCMGPVAMLLAGFTIANYSVRGMLKKTKVYIATLLRLIVIPAIIVAFVFGLKEAANALFGLTIGNTVLFLCYFSVGAPLGLNTVVFPEAYGGNPETGASMTMISHTLCVLSIPLMYALMVTLFGPAAIPTM